MKFQKVNYILILFFFYSAFTFSHPHVFFDTTARVEMDGKKLEGIELSLLLDDMNTLLNQKVFKPSKDGEVEEKNIVFLKYVYSHIRIFWNGKQIPKRDILFELASLEDEQLRIDFFVSIDKLVKPKDSLRIALYDTNYYYTYDYNKKSFVFHGNTQKTDRFFTDKGISFYFKTVHPDIYEVVFQ